MASEESEVTASGAHNDYGEARRSKFKFKSRSKRSRRREEDDGNTSHHRNKRRRSEEPGLEYHRHSHRSTRSRRHRGESAEDDAQANQASSSNGLDSETAFRESLFDAMADDEGAAFWEGVYGQPIHVYPQDQPNAQGELEHMTDEEYAEYVRSRMWEKTHQHVIEERARREERRRRRRAEEELEDIAREQAERERKSFDAKIAASLRRGEERKEKRRWQDAWQRYLDGWEKFTQTIGEKSKVEGSLEGKAARGVISWPVESGKWKHVEKGDIAEFFRKTISSGDELPNVLKVERVRWHPDKMQQRFGANRLDEETVRAITAVFQVVDGMWGELRDKKK